MAETTRVFRHGVRAGDIVFDALGGQHVVTSVRNTKRTTKVVRGDGETISLADGEKITVIQGGLRSMGDDEFDALIDKVSVTPEEPFSKAVLAEAIRRDEAEAGDG